MSAMKVPLTVRVRNKNHQFKVHNLLFFLFLFCFEAVSLVSKELGILNLF